MDPYDLFEIAEVLLTGWTRSVCNNSTNILKRDVYETILMNTKDIAILIWNLESTETPELYCAE